MGGDLSVETLLLAYHFGIFPWYSEEQPILWWSPNPRCILWPDELKVSKSMRSLLAKNPFRITADHAFDEVILACKNHRRKDQDGTWITDEMQWAYQKLHLHGAAHSIEVWKGSDLVAGLYGLSLGKVFFGESMFTRVSNGSKYGFIKLVGKLKEASYTMIDCQQNTAHLQSLGATLIAQEDFLGNLKANMLCSEDLGSWRNWQF
ncbi:MAG: leucyl/phenylalanyl-tRNA--protein transferase [Saprospiraceae bacterium]|nr:leucyl/phenylalanyl-tRNA--protein transferase [Saprospiraceae bacterium]